MKEFQRFEIYMDDNELEMVAYLTGYEFDEYAKAHAMRRLSSRTVVNEAGQVFEIFAYILIVGAPKASRTSAYWRALRNHLQAVACCVNVYSKEYKNINSRIRWIEDHRIGYYLPF